MGKLGAPGAASLLTWRSLGPRWGIRRVPASPRARCAPGRRRPAPALAEELALHGSRGLARGPGKLVCPVGGGSRGSPIVLAFPRPLSARPSSVAALFPPLPATGQTGFSAPGWCLPSPFGSCGCSAPQRPGRVQPSALPLSLPGGGERLDGEPLRRPTRPRSSPAPSVRPGGRWAQSLWPPPRRLRDLAAAVALSSPSGPAPPGGRARHPASPASLSRRPRPSWPPPGVGDRASPESWRGHCSPELSSLGKESCTLSMPSHVPGQVTECVSQLDARSMGKETVPKDFKKLIL